VAGRTEAAGFAEGCDRSALQPPANTAHSPAAAMRRNTSQVIGKP
jgi:hypothetical protein